MLYLCDVTIPNTMSRTMAKSPVEMLSYRSLVRRAMSLSLPGNLKKCEYIDVLKLHRMGLEAECRELAFSFKMKTKKRSAVKKSLTNNLAQRKSVCGRPRKLSVKVEPLFLANDLVQRKSTGSTHIFNDLVEPFFDTSSEVQTSQHLKSTFDISEMFHCSSLQPIDCHPPIAKSTSERLRSVLLSADRSKFNHAAENNNNNNNNCNNCTFYNFKQENILIPKLETPENSYLLDLQSFPDIPQLADVVDINANFDLDNFNSINYLNKNTKLFVDDSDTLSTPSAAENTEQEQRDIDRRWAMSIHTDNLIKGSHFMECGETLNSLENNSLFGLQDSVLAQNDVIQNYIDKNDVQFMQLPDSSCEVIEALQFYESNVASQSLSEHNVNESVSNEHSVQDNDQLNLAETSHTLAEFANMLPCPIAGCVWHSHSETLYVHLYSCHQQMISYGNSITHVFKCQDIQNFCFFTHLQFVQNTIYIITVTFDSYSHTFVATIQHVSSYGDNTSPSPTTAELTAGFLHVGNDRQNSWIGQVQPYSVPLNVLHADGRCLFIDPSDFEQRVVVHVNITNPMLTCL